MFTFRILLVFFAAFCVSVPASAVAPLTEVLLSLDEAQVLPGVPTGVTVTVVNRGEASIQVPRALWIIASAENQTFPLSNLMSLQGAPVRFAAEKSVIPAGASAEFRFDPSEVIIGTTWLLDERLSRPDRYELTAVFAEEVDQEGRFDASRAFFSNLVNLIVEQPTGEDAAVWEWMKERGNGGWSDFAWQRHSGALASFVMSNHPDSRYALYVALWSLEDDPDSKNELLERLITKYPDASISERLRMALAHRYVRGYSLANASPKAYSGRRPERAQSQLKKARKLLSDLESSAASDLTRREAARLRASLPKPEQISDRQ